MIFARVVSVGRGVNFSLVLDKRSSNIKKNNIFILIKEIQKNIFCQGCPLVIFFKNQYISENIYRDKQHFKLGIVLVFLSSWVNHLSMAKLTTFNEKRCASNQSLKIC